MLTDGDSLGCWLGEGPALGTILRGSSAIIHAPQKRRRHHFESIRASAISERRSMCESHGNAHTAPVSGTVQPYRSQDLGTHVSGICLSHFLCMRCGCSRYYAA